MKIGPFLISRVRRNKAGLKVYPWQALTEDRVTPELRQIIAKMARSEVKNLLAALRETNGDFNCPNQAIICPEDHLCSVCPRANKTEQPAKVCVSSHCVENQHVLMDPREDA